MVARSLAPRRLSHSALQQQRKGAAFPPLLPGFHPYGNVIPFIAIVKWSEDSDYAGHMLLSAMGKREKAKGDRHKADHSRGEVLPRLVAHALMQPT